MTEQTNMEEMQYLTFKLEDEVFAVEVGKVREILDYVPATRIPGTLDFMRGIISVRGNVMPVVDMRAKFGMSIAGKTVSTCIIVVELFAEGERIVLGAVVDSVQEVFELAQAQIEPPPRIGMKWKTGFLKGVGKRNDSLFIVLDIDKVFTSSELAAVQCIENSMPPLSESLMCGVSTQ